MATVKSPLVFYFIIFIEIKHHILNIYSVGLTRRLKQYRNIEQNNKLASANLLFTLLKFLNARKIVLTISFILVKIVFG